MSRGDRNRRREDDVKQGEGGRVGGAGCLALNVRLRLLVFLQSGAGVDDGIKRSWTTGSEAGWESLGQPKRAVERPGRVVEL